MTAEDQKALMEVLRDAWKEAGSTWASGRHPVWVMDRGWYDRIRAAFVSEAQERDRAWMHQQLVVPVVWPFDTFTCMACPAGPFPDREALAGHLEHASDPAYREPAAGDWLMGCPLSVRDGGGEPHLEAA